MKFLEIFTPLMKGDFGLTDEYIYKSIDFGGPFIPIWGGNQEHHKIDRLVSVHGKTKLDKKITVFENEGIILSLDGSAGSMTYKDGKQKFALNHHAGFFKKKNNSKIDLEFFSIFYQKQLQELSVSEGSKTLTQDQLYSADFDIPDYSNQMKIMKNVKPLLSIRRKLDEIFTQKIDELFKKQIVKD